MMPVDTMADNPARTEIEENTMLSVEVVASVGCLVSESGVELSDGGIKRSGRGLAGSYSPQDC